MVENVAVELVAIHKLTSMRLIQKNFAAILTGVCLHAWRLPTRKELLTLVLGTGDGEKNTTIDTHYFPSTPGDWYWTADTDLGDASHAWYVLFYNGRSMKASMSQAKRVRLVRGGTEQRRSFKDVAEKKGNAPKNELAKQPFQPEPSSTAKQEMISLK